MLIDRTNSKNLPLNRVRRIFNDVVYIENNNNIFFLLYNSAVSEYNFFGRRLAENILNTHNFFIRSTKKLIKQSFLRFWVLSFSPGVCDKNPQHNSLENKRAGSPDFELIFFAGQVLCARFMSESRTRHSVPSITTTSEPLTSVEWESERNSHYFSFRLEL
jgi:hypothetical protein